MKCRQTLGDKVGDVSLMHTEGLTSQGIDFKLGLMNSNSLEIQQEVSGTF